MKPVIHLRDIVKHYKIGTIIVEALKSISIDINKNEYVAIMGPSGSGKSTLMNLIGCLDTATRGSYVLNGTDVSKMADDELAEIRNKEIGFVFQTFNLLPRYTAMENIMLPLIYAGFSKTDRSERALSVIEDVGLTDRMQHRPNELSGGQRQRVAIARAMVNNPSIILADEPTGNLDLKTGKEIITLLRQMNKDKNVSIITATHDLKMLDVSDRVIWLRDGMIERVEDRENITIKVGEVEGEEGG